MTRRQWNGTIPKRTARDGGDNKAAAARLAGVRVEDKVTNAVQVGALSDAKRSELFVPRHSQLAASRPGHKDNKMYRAPVSADHERELDSHFERSVTDQAVKQVDTSPFEFGHIVGGVPAVDAEVGTGQAEADCATATVAPAPAPAPAEAPRSPGDGDVVTREESTVHAMSPRRSSKLGEILTSPTDTRMNASGVHGNRPEKKKPKMMQDLEEEACIDVDELKAMTKDRRALAASEVEEEGDEMHFTVDAHSQGVLKCIGGMYVINKDVVGEDGCSDTKGKMRGDVRERRERDQGVGNISTSRESGETNGSACDNRSELITDASRHLMRKQVMLSGIEERKLMKGPRSRVPRAPVKVKVDVPGGAHRTNGTDVVNEVDGQDAAHLLATDTNWAIAAPEYMQRNNVVCMSGKFGGSPSLTPHDATSAPAQVSQPTSPAKSSLPRRTSVRLQAGQSGVVTESLAEDQALELATGGPSPQALARGLDEHGGDVVVAGAQSKPTVFPRTEAQARVASPTSQRMGMGATVDTIRSSCPLEIPGLRQRHRSCGSFGTRASMASLGSGTGWMGSSRNQSIVNALGMEPPSEPPEIVEHVARAREVLHKLGGVQVDLFLREQAAYDAVFWEVVRQCAVECVERGTLLALIFVRLRSLLASVPAALDTAVKSLEVVRRENAVLRARVRTFEKQDAIREKVSHKNADELTKVKRDRGEEETMNIRLRIYNRELSRQLKETAKMLADKTRDLQVIAAEREMSREQTRVELSGELAKVREELRLHGIAHKRLVDASKVQTDRFSAARSRISELQRSHFQLEEENRRLTAEREEAYAAYAKLREELDETKSKVKAGEVLVEEAQQNAQELTDSLADATMRVTKLRAEVKEAHKSGVAEAEKRRGTNVTRVQSRGSKRMRRAGSRGGQDDDDAARVGQRAKSPPSGTKRRTRRSAAPAVNSAGTLLSASSSSIDPNQIVKRVPLLVRAQSMSSRRVSKGAPSQGDTVDGSSGMRVGKSGTSKSSFKRRGTGSSRSRTLHGDDKGSRGRTLSSAAASRTQLADGRKESVGSGDSVPVKGRLSRITSLEALSTMDVNMGRGLQPDDDALHGGSLRDGGVSTGSLLRRGVSMMDDRASVMDEDQNVRVSTDLSEGVFSEAATSPESSGASDRGECGHKSNPVTPVVGVSSPDSCTPTAEFEAAEFKEMIERAVPEGRSTIDVGNPFLDVDNLLGTLTRLSHGDAVSDALVNQGAARAGALEQNSTESGIYGEVDTDDDDASPGRAVYSDSSEDDECAGSGPLGTSTVPAPFAERSDSLASIAFDPNAEQDRDLVMEVTERAVAAVREKAQLQESAAAVPVCGSPEAGRVPEGARRRQEAMSAALFGSAKARAVKRPASQSYHKHRKPAVAQTEDVFEGIKRESPTGRTTERRRRAPHMKSTSVAGDGATRGERNAHTTNQRIMTKSYFVGDDSLSSVESSSARVPRVAILRESGRSRSSSPVTLLLEAARRQGKGPMMPIRWLNR